MLKKDTFGLKHVMPNKSLADFFEKKSGDGCQGSSGSSSCQGVNDTQENIESESELSDDSFLVAIDNGTFSLENAVDPQPEPLEDHSSSCSKDDEEYTCDVPLQSELHQPLSVEDIINNFLRNELNLQINVDFKTQDLKELLASKPVVKAILENNLNRKHPHSPHNTLIKELIIKHALKFSYAAALAISELIGGPLKSTIKKGCLVDVKILPYLCLKNMEKHLQVFIETLQSYIKDPNSNIKDIGKIPIQVGIDATPVTGKMSTRKVDGLQENIRLLYGIHCRTNQKPVISLEKIPDRPILSISKRRDRKQFLFINGMESVPQLMKENKIKRVFSYFSIVALPLVQNAKPYCLAIVSQGKGFTHEEMKSIHISVCDAFSRAGLRVITIPGKLCLVIVIHTNLIQFPKLLFIDKGINLV